MFSVVFFLALISNLFLFGSYKKCILSLLKIIFCDERASLETTVDDMLVKKKGKRKKRGRMGRTTSNVSMLS